MPKILYSEENTERTKIRQIVKGKFSFLFYQCTLSCSSLTPSSLIS
jgi:hypothetical protein